MKTTPFLVALSVCFFGCAAHPLMHPETAKRHAEMADAESATHGDIDETLDAPAETAVDPRKPGDFVVFSFDGSYRTAPLQLTERVISRTDGAITVDLAFQEKGKPTEELRVTTNLLVGHAGEVLRVQRRDAKGAFSDAPVATYDSLVAMTVASADVNDAELSSVPAVATVGANEIPVTKTTYRVRIGRASATMQTLSSDTFAWGDVGGEIKTNEGNLFYRATLVDMGSDPSSVASLDQTTTTAN